METAIQSKPDKKNTLKQMDTIFHLPPVVENILKHLGAHDLCRCAQVCKLWSSMVATENKRRNNIEWFFQGHLDYRLVKQYKHPAYKKLSARRSAFAPCLQKQLENIQCRPSLCIAFVSSNLYENFDGFFPAWNTFFGPDRKKVKLDKFNNLLCKRKFIAAVLEYTVMKYMPADAIISVSIAPGIIASKGDYTPVEIEDGSAITGVCFPKFPGVETHYFSLDGSKIKLNDVIPDEKKIKCMLAFLTPRGLSLSEELIRRCIAKEEGSVAIGGSLVTHTESLVGSIIAFTGENIEAASLIITQKDKKEEIKSKLKVFQDTGLLQNRCFAFMFTCVARGYQFHRCHNFESDTFRSLYPRVPLIGLFGNGEIGINYLPHLPPEDHKTFVFGNLVRIIKKYQHTYSTVFVLLSVRE